MSVPADLPPAGDAPSPGRTLGQPGLDRNLPVATMAAILAAYAAQGFGYATVATALPTFKERIGLSEAMLSVLLLGVCAAAALGSVLADLIAVRRGSRAALAAGFLAQVASLAIVATTTSLPVFAAAIGVYGVGLGTVDAACNMQGALAQARSSQPVFGKLYAAYTLAAILGALATSGVRSTSLPPTTPLLISVAVALVTSVVVWRFGDRYVATRFGRHESRRPDHDDSPRIPLPRAGIWIVGGLVFAAFVVDSAVSSWSTLYMQDGLDASASVAPLAYAAYLAIVLAGRVAADPMVRRWGRRTTSVTGALVALAGCALVVAVHTPGVAIAGFALTGAAAGLLVPVAFSWAGELQPERSDEVIARVNLFNYGGAVVGAAALGALAGNASALAFGFLLPALALIAALPLVRAIAPGTRDVDQG